MLSHFPVSDFFSVLENKLEENEIIGNTCEKDVVGLKIKRRKC